MWWSRTWQDWGPTPGWATQSLILLQEHIMVPQLVLVEHQILEHQSHPVLQVNKNGKMTTFSSSIFQTMDFWQIFIGLFSRESDGEADDLQRTAQYLTRNVILYTHYAGEVSNIVDEHFTKALNQSTFNENKGKQISLFRHFSCNMGGELIFIGFHQEFYFQHLSVFIVSLRTLRIHSVFRYLG